MRERDERQTDQETDRDRETLRKTDRERERDRERREEKRERKNRSRPKAPKKKHLQHFGSTCSMKGREGEKEWRVSFSNKSGKTYGKSKNLHVGSMYFIAAPT